MVGEFKRAQQGEEEKEEEQKQEVPEKLGWMEWMLGGGEEAEKKTLAQLKAGFRRRLNEGVDGLNIADGGGGLTWKFKDKLLVFKHHHADTITDAIVKICASHLRIDDDKAPRFIVTAHIRTYIARVNVCRVYFGVLWNS